MENETKIVVCDKRDGKIGITALGCFKPFENTIYLYSKNVLFEYVKAHEKIHAEDWRRFWLLRFSYKFWASKILWFPFYCGFIATALFLAFELGDVSWLLYGTIPTLLFIAGLSLISQYFEWRAMMKAWRKIGEEFGVS